MLFQGFRAGNGEGDGLNLVRRVVDALVGGIGDGAKAGKVGLVGIVKADDPERNAPGGNPFSHNRFRIFGAQFLGLGRAKDHHFSTLLEIVRIQEASGRHAQLHLFLVFRHHSLERATHGVSVKGEGDAGVAGCAGNIVDDALPLFTGGIVKIGLIQLDDSAFLVAFVGLGGAPAFHRDVLGNKVGHAAHEGVHEAVSGSQQRDEQEDAPAHCKTREGRAELVGAQGAAYFVKELSHYLMMLPPQAE